MITVRVNGRVHELEVLPHESLADALRDRLSLYGVRITCAAGECGCCTVLVDGEAVTSCLMLAMQADGRSVTTIEGIGTPEHLDPLQEAFIEHQAFQCAFCTPGFIMNAKTLLEKNPHPTEDEVVAAMSGNICRCGSYPYIIQAVMAAASRQEA
jgi:aerobic carbon-monoxide dehydrogenase small subunit